MSDEFDALEEEFAQAASQPDEEQDLSLATEDPPEEEVVEEQEAAEAEPVPVEPVSEESQPEQETPVEAKTYTVPDDPSFGEHRGKKFTAIELDQLGLLEKINTREHQELHHTKLYPELKAKFDALEAKIAQQDVQTQQTQAFSPEAIARNAGDTERAYMKPLTDLAKAGAFEEDFLVSYPKVATQLEQRFDAGTGALMALNQRLQAIEQSFGSREETARRTENQNTVFNSINQVVSDDEGTYGVLADETARKGFIGWIVDPSNPLPFKDMPVDRMTPDVIRAAYLAYVQANPGIVQPTPSAPPVTQGQGTTGTKVRQAVSEFQAMENEFNHLAESRFGG